MATLQEFASALLERGGQRAEEELEDEEQTELLSPPFIHVTLSMCLSCASRCWQWGSEGRGRLQGNVRTAEVLLVVSQSAALSSLQVARCSCI